MITNCKNRICQENYDDESFHEMKCCRPSSHEKKCCKSSSTGKAILKCGAGAVGPLPILDLVGASIINPYSLASVTIDTSGMKNPTVLINVTALINVPVGALPSITFRLVRTCNGASQPVGGSYTYSDCFDLLHSESFAFQFCDCGQCCCGCTTYTVEISSATLAQAGTTISGNISALAVENNC